MVSEAAAHGPDLVVMHTVLDPKPPARASVGGNPLGSQVGGANSHTPCPTGQCRGCGYRCRAGRYRMAGRSPATGKGEVSMGEWGVITSGRHHLLVTSLPAITADPATWRHAGLDPDRADILVVRSCSDYRANFPSAAPEAINLDLPGASTPKLESLHFEHAPRPLYPLDPVLT